MCCCCVFLPTGVQSANAQCYVAIQAYSSGGDFNQVVTSTRQGITNETPLTIRNGFGTYCVRTLCPSRYSPATISFRRGGNPRAGIVAACNMDGSVNYIAPRDPKCFGSLYECERNTNSDKILFFTVCSDI